MDFFCCAERWDGMCAEQAAGVCGLSCGCPAASRTED
jgi:hypothetical protein